MGLLEKIFGNYSEKEIKKIKPIVAKIEALGPQFESYTDEELKAQNPGEDLSMHPARFALVELENIHDDAQAFEPIHRVVFKTNPEKLLSDLQASCCAEGGFRAWSTRCGQDNLHSY